MGHRISLGPGVAPASVRPPSEMASADKSRLPSSFDGRDMSNEMESAGRQNRNRSKGGRERGGERDFVTVRLEAHVRLNRERMGKRGGDKERRLEIQRKARPLVLLAMSAARWRIPPPFFMAVVDKLATPPP